MSSRPCWPDATGRSARLPPTDYTVRDHYGAMASVMALNIKNPEVERLAAQVAELTGESKTEAPAEAGAMGSPGSVA